jgi:RNA polymerase sigma-70 factor (ECF subfamily)
MGVTGALGSPAVAVGAAVGVAGGASVGKPVGAADGATLGVAEHAMSRGVRRPASSGAAGSLRVLPRLSAMQRAGYDHGPSVAPVRLSPLANPSPKLRQRIGAAHLWSIVNASPAVDEIRGVLSRAALGEVDAFGQIVARHHADMARVCAVICDDADVAADAVQSAWPIAWRRLGTLRDPSRLRPWLISIAANQARQYQRRERRRRVVEIQVVPASPGAELDDRVAMVDLGRALARLNADERALLALRFVAELDSAEIGQALGLSASGARSRLERLVARLRKELRDG